MHEPPRTLERLAMASALGVATFVVDRDLRYVLAEGQALAEACRCPDDFVGRTVAEVHGPDDAQPVADFAAALGGERFRREHSVGDRRFLTNGGPIRSPAGEVLGAIATSIDITDQWRAERLAHAQAQTLGDIAAGRPAEACLDTLGRHAQALRPGLRVAVLVADGPRRAFERVISPQLGPGFAQALVGAPIGPEPLGTCGWAVHKAMPIECTDLPNDAFWASAWRALCLSLGVRAVYSQPVFDQHGVAVGSVMLGFDREGAAGPLERTLADYACSAIRVLLEREAAQRLAVAHEAERARTFERIADAGPAMLWTLDARGLATYASRAWYAFTGLAPGEALGAGWLDAVHPDDRAGVDGRMREQLRARSAARFECRMRHRQPHRHHWVIVEVRTTSDPQDRFTGSIGLVVDIDELRRAHELLSREDQRKDRFLATLAHELRNPLAPIGAGLALLRRSPAGPAVVAEVTEMMDRQFRQLTRLVDDLLDTSRIKTGRLRLRVERVDLGHVVRTALETVRPKVLQRRQTLSLRSGPAPVEVQGDAVRLGQIVSNLLDNASKYTQEGGALQLRVVQDGDEALIEVEDDGHGIAPERQHSVFDWFDRADREHPGDPRSQVDGLGIGLYLVRALVGLHGGRVELHSEGLGHGTQVRVRLPLPHAGAEPPPAGSWATATPAAAPAAGAPVSVLVVDDNHDAAQTLALLFESLGCEVQVAFDGASALVAAQRRPPRLAVLDIGMPGMDGHELARRLRLLPRTTPLTLVALSGWGHEADRQRSRAAGIDLHWVKPVEEGAVVGLLGALRRSDPSAVRPDIPNSADGPGPDPR